MREENIGRSIVQVPRRLGEALYVLVLDNKGSQLEPQPLIPAAVPHGGMLPLVPLLPGRHRNTHALVTLRGPWLAMQLFAPVDATSGKLELQLTHRTTIVHVALHVGKDVVARVWTDRTRTKLLYTFASECRSAEGGSFNSSGFDSNWMPVKLGRVRADNWPCPGYFRWRALVGSLNSSVTEINYSHG